jgi:hypothetical protein
LSTNIRRFIHFSKSICNKINTFQRSYERLTSTLSLHEVKELAGHAGIETTERFYLAVRKDILDRARAASEASRRSQSVARLLRAASDSNEDPITLSVSNLQSKL